MYHILEHVFPREVISNIIIYSSHQTADIMRQRLLLHEHDTYIFLTLVRNKYPEVPEHEVMDRLIRFDKFYFSDIRAQRQARQQGLQVTWRPGMPKPLPGLKRRDPKLRKGIKAKPDPES